MAVLYYHYFGRFLELSLLRQCGHRVGGGRSGVVVVAARIAGRVC